MRTNWAKSALVAVLAASATFGIVASACAQTTPADEPRIDNLDMRSAPLLIALKALTDQTGVQFIIEPSDKPFDKVTLKLGAISVEDALKYVCESAGAYFRRDESGVYIISHNKPEVAKVVADPPAAPAAAQHKVVKKINLLHASPKDVYERMYDINPNGPGGQVFDTRVWEGLNYFQSLSQRSNLSMQKGVQMQSSATPNMSPAVGDLTVPNHPFVAPETGSQIALPGESGNQTGPGLGSGFGGGGQNGGLGGGQNGGLGGGQNGGLGGGQQQNLTLTPGQGYVPIGIDHSSYDPTDNSIIVEGTDDAIEQLRKTIELFDTAPKQVTVKVEFISTSSDLAKEIGYDWLYQRGTIITGNLPGAFADAGNPIFASFSTGNIAVNMRTQLITDHGKIVNAPIIRTLNNQPATLFTTTTTTLLLDSVITSGTGSIVTAPQLAQIQVTTSLTVAPRINRDGTVTMYLTPTYSDFGTVHQLPDGSQVPDTFSEGVNVVARVKDGETIVLGGLVHKNDTTQIIKYPILADLPIIGQFFRKVNTNNTDTELLIFVTPTVIQDDTGANQGV